MNKNSTIGDKFTNYKTLAAICIAFGLLGYPLGVFVVADGGGLVAVAVYTSATLLIALGLSVWLSEQIMNQNAASDLE